jgi:hypothetical protein
MITTNQSNQNKVGTQLTLNTFLCNRIPKSFIPYTYLKLNTSKEFEELSAFDKITSNDGIQYTDIKRQTKAYLLQTAYIR